MSNDILSKLTEISGGPESACTPLHSSSFIEKMYGVLEGFQQNTASYHLSSYASPDSPSLLDNEGKWVSIGKKEIGWNDKYKIRGLAIYKDHLFISVENSLWSYDGKDLNFVKAFSDHDINNLASDEKYLYLAISGEKGGVYIYDGSTFHHISKGLTSHSNNIGCYSLCAYNGDLYVGCDPCEVFKLAGSTFQKIGGNGHYGSWNDLNQYGALYDLKIYQSKLYAAMARRGYGPSSASVWCYDGKVWSRIGGDGLLGSWIHPHICYVLDLQAYNDLLFASLTRPKTMPGFASSVYAFNGSTWFPIGLKGISHLLSESHIYNCMLPFAGRLYLATGDIKRHIPAIWELSSCGTTWKQVAGGPNDYGWPFDLAPEENAIGRTGGSWIYKMIEFKGELYAAMAGFTGGAQLWKYQVKKKAVTKKRTFLSNFIPNFLNTTP